jgi:hypothetical protein
MCAFDHLGFRAIAKLSQLERLNLFGTRPYPANLVPIAQGCPKLRWLNLGHTMTSERVADDAILAFARQ